MLKDNKRTVEDCSVTERFFCCPHAIPANPWKSSKKMEAVYTVCKPKWNKNFLRIWSRLT